MALFQQFNLMDYSLLFAVEKVGFCHTLKSGRPRAVEQDQIDFNPPRSSTSYNAIPESSFSQNEDITPHTNRHKYVSSCGQYIYHLAIIDYLQTFNFEKKSESRLKIWILRRPAHLISAVEPSVYGDRFIRFMTQEVLIDSNLIQKDVEALLKLDDDRV